VSTTDLRPGEVWAYGVNLACDHTHRIVTGFSNDFNDACRRSWGTDRRKDGWPKAQRCPECGRARAVSSPFVKRLAEYIEP
jgi:hypothetical protein